VQDLKSDPRVAADPVQRSRLSGLSHCLWSFCLPLAAIATVCDVVPLRDENRALVRSGLATLSRLPADQHGLRALFAIAQFRKEADVTAQDVAFQIGPRLNASGRLGSAETAVRLFLADDKDTAAVLAKQLDGLNDERKRIEVAVATEAIRMVPPILPAASSSEAHACDVLS
jgi:single-stranded-DNA-specific exonuclease